MKTYKNLYQKLCSEENLALAFRKARKRKSTKPYVIEFEKNLEGNLQLLKTELLLNSYRPKPLRTFVIREPKTRKIRKSYFVDRIIHHAICNVLEPIFEERFIYDSYANRKGKGSLNALKRFDNFKIKVSKNNTRNCYIFKADIKHYFDEVNHNILINILRKKITDERLIFLISKILENHSQDIGMPLGNMTSQFFANVYLNELDQFVKHRLKAKFYIRYVDDFVILHDNKQSLEGYSDSINIFLKERLNLQLHPNKSKILLLNRGIPFLGFRNYSYHRLLRKSNVRWMKKRIKQDSDYDSLCIYMEGWLSYASHANTHKLKHNVTDNVESNFNGHISSLHLDRLIKQAGATISA
ncbi:MAG TPA: hypothetical protein ENI23_13255 [bacterium]|nr:hypothetical protein [bacterium]